ncbi:MAG: hypothetical protein KGN84_21235 [Acidobacteriota bacterium]|nr:hypothetical protein [Acidobacteriota bacterium]
MAPFLFALGLSAAPPPVALYPGLGIWTHPIATSNATAQKFFDQGLALMYGFNRPEALRSFRKAAELDPGAAMAQWGISMSLGPYVNMDLDPDVHIPEACAAAKGGLALARDAEKPWLEAAAARCPDYSDPAKYTAAARRLAQMNPDDPDAQTVYAEALLLPVRWHWYGPDGKPAEGVAEAETLLEATLRRFPNHPGANHLYVHAVESSPNPERGIPSAQRLMGLVPAAGHLVHMPGHIWLVLGDYKTAVDVNLRAAEVDRRYFAKSGDTGSSYYMYYLHNIQFIVYGRSMQGRVADTKKAIAQLEQAAAPMEKMMPEMSDIFDPLAAMTRLRVNLWDDVLAAKPASRSAQGETWRHFARGMAFAGKGDRAKARDEQQSFETARAKIDRNAPWGNNKTGPVLDLAAETLAARCEASPEAALPHWRKAVETQDALVYDEPPAWYYPVRESLGAALLQSGDAAGAEAVFREGARRSPRNGRMLFGLRESLKAQGKTGAAAWVDREYKAAWDGADLTLRIGEM